MPASVVSFYHDIEQDIDSNADVNQCRRMVQEFLRLEGKYGVPATYNVVGRLFRDQPDLIDQIREAGQEVAFHSYHHQADWQPKYYAEEVRLCRQVAAFPRGYRSPRSAWDRQTIKACWQQGMVWNAESDRCTTPYCIYKDLVRIPIAADDWPLQSGKMQVAAWVDYACRRLQGRRYAALGCHDSVVSFAADERLWAWDQVVQKALATGALVVNFSTAAEMCRHGEF